jgi:hypothetical protein
MEPCIVVENMIWKIYPKLSPCVGMKALSHWNSAMGMQMWTASLPTLMLARSENASLQADGLHPADRPSGNLRVASDLIHSCSKRTKSS